MSNELSGTVNGPAVQAGSIRDVHIHQPAASTPVPRQLPPPAPHFTSRADALARLDGLLDRGGRLLVALIGPGGVGKTALALGRRSSGACWPYCCITPEKTFGSRR
ncbi:hypothetical protein ACQP1P_40785 [Dactylosporangium sp. CA-052675]|uniref:hypothetical protein n=1 Tax=Dactylosporangium sp. CA-052675 TaxID=3239927 RepID=UPI003D8FEFEE